ncbi:N-6 DNA methylase [Streptomyces sp. NPDC002690]
MRIAEHQQQLVSRAAIAELAGVQRSAITNWERRYTDFPSPTRAGGTDYYHLSDVLTWLKDRPVPLRARREGERADVTYADRARTALVAASEAEAVEDLETDGFPAARGTAGDETDGEHLGSADDLFREQDEGRWGTGARVNFLYLLFSLIYLRWAQPRRWALVRRSVAQDQAGTHILRFLPAVAQHVQQSLAAQGVTSAMAVRLEDLTPSSPHAVVRLLDKIESSGRESFTELLGHHALEAGLGSRDAFTPPGVARLLASLLGKSSSAQSLYDPNGRGGELLSAVLAARPEPGNEVGEGIPAVTIGSAHPETRDLAAMNLMVHGARPEWLNFAGATRPWTEGSQRRRADLVLTNPPFNVSAVPVDADRWPYGEPPVSNANLAWPQLAVMSLNEGGRAAVLMPNSAATSSNLKEQRIRHALVDRGALECVIALPAKMFSATMISVNVWILRSDAQERNSGEVLFIDASGLATKVSRKLSVLEADDCALIAAAYHSWRGTGGNDAAVLPDSRLPCAAVRRDAVNAAGSSLRPADYARPAKRSHAGVEELTDPYGALLRSREEAGRADDLADSQVAGFRHFDGGLGLLIDDAPDDWEWRSLGELCDLQAGPSPSLLPKDAYVPDGVVPVVQPKHLRDRLVADARGTAVPYDREQRLRRFALQDGDILCARTGTVGPVAQVRTHQVGWLFGSNLIRLHRFAPEVCPAYLLAYLSLSRTTEWIKSRSEKTTVPSISKADLGTLPVHLPPWSEQKRIAGALGALDEQIARHLEVARAATQVRRDLAEQLVGRVAVQGPTAPASAGTFPGRTSR